MTAPEILETPQNRRIAYHRTTGKGPGVVFLGGFKSDMEGSKALYLEDWAKRTGRAFLRFDYSGHGQSSEAFEDGAIGDWAEDAIQAISTLTEGPQVLVGSSMGGWISLLVAKAIPDRVAGFVGIAAAPDFTEDGFWAGFSDDQRATILQDCKLELPSEYEDSPYIITRRLIEDGRDHLVMRSPLSVPGTVRLMQGTEDGSVDGEVPLNLLAHIEAQDVRLTLVKGADHRFSSPECLALIENAIEEVLAG